MRFPNRLQSRNLSRHAALCGKTELHSQDVPTCRKRGEAIFANSPFSAPKDLLWRIGRPSRIEWKVVLGIAERKANWWNSPKTHTPLANRRPCWIREYSMQDLFLMQKGNSGPKRGASGRWYRTVTDTELSFCPMQPYWYFFLGTPNEILPLVQAAPQLREMDKTKKDKSKFLVFSGGF